MFNIINIPYNDAKTWELIQTGQTLGVFQCESKLVRNWLKKIKPSNIWELSAVVAIVRPGPLQSGFAEEFVKNRENTDNIESFGHPIIDDVFRTTNGILLYQESLMNLGARLAWSHLPENERGVKVDNLRKGVGKKDQAKLVAIGKEFVDGCIANKVDSKIANKLFEVIKNCGRYLFNLSHSISYAHLAYKTAYLKANYPLQFYCTYLTYSIEKQNIHKDDNYLNDLVNDARIHNIEILPPNINKKNLNFAIDGDKIRFGLGHIKFFSNVAKEILPSLPPITTWQQLILIGLTDTFGKKFNSRTMEALISTNCFVDIKIGRKQQLRIYKLFQELTARELSWCVEKMHDYSVDRIGNLISECANIIANVRRRQILLDLVNLFVQEKDNYDNPSWIALQEQTYLELPLTASSVDDKGSDSAFTCLDCCGKFPKYEKRSVNAVIKQIIRTKTKKGNNPGQEMARLTVYDSTGSLDNLPLFPEQYTEYQDLLIERNTVTLNLYMGNSGWIIESLVKI